MSGPGGGQVPASPELLVVRPGALTTVQDAGRPGLAHLAVPRSGALDGPAYALANQLVGNPAGAAVLETTLDGVAVRCPAGAVVAVTGSAARVTVGGEPARWGEAVRVPAGAVVDVGRAVGGVRSYLAVCGGIAVQPVLGSRSRDLLSGLGPPVLRAGMRLPLGAAPPTAQPPTAQPPTAQPAGARPAGAEHAPAAQAPAAAGEPAGILTLGLQLGPREDHLTARALRLLAGETWTVSPDSNRIGLRLAGPALRRRLRAELPSEPMVLGAVQVPGDGAPVVFLADHPTTGGYPVVGVVAGPDLQRCAQARPGARVRFDVRPGWLTGSG